MKEFDIEKLERRMPYSVPENFFEEFTAQTIARAGTQQSKVRRMRVVRFAASFASVAAVIVIMLSVGRFATPINEMNITVPTQSENALLSSVEIDSFISSLSDDELSSLISEVNHEEEFYDYL